MSQPSMPKVHRGGESDRSGCGSGGGVHRVEAIRAVTSVEHHPGTGVLNRKTHFVKFNSYRIFTCKRTNETRLVTNSGETKTLDM